jgi:hypothetical protein
VLAPLWSGKKCFEEVDGADCLGKKVRQKYKNNKHGKYEMAAQMASAHYLP